MDFKATIGILVMLTVCKLSSQNLVMKMQVFEGPKHYIHYQGKDCELECTRNPSVANLKMEFLQFVDGKWKTVENAEKQGSKISIKLNANVLSEERRFACEAEMSGMEKERTEATVETVGEKPMDVYLANYFGKTLIKSSDKGPLELGCITGGKVGDIISNPVQIFYGDKLIYENGNGKEGLKGINSSSSLGGYEVESVYHSVIFNEPLQAVGTITCKRGTSEHKILFTDKDDVGRVQMTLLQNGVQKGVLSKSADDTATPPMKTLTVLRVGNYDLYCSVDGGYPTPVVALTKNGLAVKATPQGNTYKAALKLTTADQYLACDVQVPGLDKHVLKFKIDVNEDPMPANCTTKVQTKSVIRSCKVGSKTRAASCGEVKYEVKYRTSGKVAMVIPGEPNDNTKDHQITCNNNKGDNNIITVDLLINAPKENIDIALIHTGLSKKTDKLDEHTLKPLTGPQDTGAAVALSSFGKLALTLLASAAIFLY